jgi:hypothetical protein
MTKKYMVSVAHTHYYYRYVEAHNYDEAEDMVIEELGTDNNRKLNLEGEDWEVYMVEELTA